MRPLRVTLVVIGVVQLFSGVASLARVTTAAFPPVGFAAALLWWHPRRERRAA